MNGSTSDQIKGVDEVLAEYLQARAEGTPIDPEALLRQYPMFADEIREFLDDSERAAHALRPLAEDRVPAGDDPARPPAAADARLPDASAAFGDYELLEEIGRGGMGIVYRTRQRSLNRVVALKVIAGGQFASSDDVRRFQVEARHAANLDHPNIVPVYEVGCHAGHHFFTMKLVGGGSLAQHRDRLGRNPRAAAALVSAVARAVHHAHQRGLLHRDLKPGNILMETDGRPMVSDFGLARRIDGGGTLTVSGAMVGSPRYMSPEQAVGAKSLTVATDVYALGAILYELLTGKPPFDAPSAMETLQQVRSADSPRPSSLGRKVPRDLETVCLKCLEKDPSRRYASAEALGQDLDRWLRHEPIEARPAGAVLRVRRWMRRHPGAAAVIAILAVALAVVTVLMDLNGRLAGDLRIALTKEEQATRELRRAVEVQEQTAEELRKKYMADLDLLWPYDEVGVADPSPVEIPSTYRPLRKDLRRGVGATPDVELRFGLYMRKKPTFMMEELDPVLTELERKLSGSLRKDVRIRFIMYPDTTAGTSYENARDALLAGEVDFMRMGPASYVQAMRDPRGEGLRLLARQRVAGHRAAIYTWEGSGIGNLKDLRGKRLAFQDKYSTTTVFAKALLVDNGIRASDLGAIIHRTNATDVTDAVRGKTVDAGAFNNTLVANQHGFLRVGDGFELFGQLWVARSGLQQEGPELLAAIEEALIELPDEVVKKLGKDIDGLVRINQEELKPVIEKVEKAETFDQVFSSPDTVPATRPSTRPAFSSPRSRTTDQER